MEVLAQQGPSWQAHVQYVGFRDFDSHFPFWGPGDLVVHLPGLTADERTTLFGLLLEMLDPVTGQVRAGQADRLAASRVAPVFNRDHVPNMDYSALNRQ